MKKLKNYKSRDLHGLVKELFKLGVAGSDFKKSVLWMSNKIKNEIFIPTFMHYSESEKDGEPRNQVPEEGWYEIFNSLLKFFRI